jgi:2-phosphoglycerate kinase
METPRVILIGGAPLTGKTTVALRLAAQLGYGCLSTDDIGTALKAVTTPQTHPDLHPEAGRDYREYLLQYGVDELVSDVQRQHRALWPAVAAVVREHAMWRGPAIIEGYALRPEWVASLDVRGVATVWLVADASAFRRRVLQDGPFLEYLQGSGRTAELVDRYVERSVRLNRLIADQAGRLGLPLVTVDYDWPVDKVCALCLERLAATE